ncbi:hypothetical protein EX30DRAFT_348316 [Ascodesmis nigricans]|uniref:Uncharacterized protein n=1 Tax=Ascodesmis nigricans TaxID=341454 RepID=A0A4S2MZ03_9PEZI|nr:hypothetical protein EX30DRAFT_348316 [Ascodesmis nigricans]
MNAALNEAKAPPHIRVQKVEVNGKGSVTAKMGPRATGIMALKYKATLVRAAGEADRAVEELKANETWHKLKLHAVRLNQYCHPETESNTPEEGLARLKEDIFNAYPEMDIPLTLKWLLHPEKLRERANTASCSMVILTLRDGKVAGRIKKEGILINVSAMSLTNYFERQA